MGCKVDISTRIIRSWKQKLPRVELPVEEPSVLQPQLALVPSSFQISLAMNCLILLIVSYLAVFFIWFFLDALFI